MSAESPAQVDVFLRLHADVRSYALKKTKTKTKQSRVQEIIMSGRRGGKCPHVCALPCFISRLRSDDHPGPPRREGACVSVFCACDDVAGGG